MEEFELALTRALEHQRLLKENAQLYAELQRLAVTDPLTGLFNRHKLGEALEIEVERSRRYGRALSVVMLDLDGLKQINDTSRPSCGRRRAAGGGPGDPGSGAQGGPANSVSVGTSSWFCCPRLTCGRQPEWPVGSSTTWPD